MPEKKDGLELPVRCGSDAPKANVQLSEPNARGQELGAARPFSKALAGIPAGYDMSITTHLFGLMDARKFSLNS